MLDRLAMPNAPNPAGPAAQRKGANARSSLTCVRRRPSSLADREIRAMSGIVSRYFPDPDQMERVVRGHLALAGTLRLALDTDGLVGFSIASVERRTTPFRRRPLPVLFQRMLYIQPEYLFRGIGQRLLLGTATDLLGPLWPFKSFVAICRTQNPYVAELIGLFSRSYPTYGRSVPANVRAFGEHLLPMLGAQALDPAFRLPGSLEGFEGADFSLTWARYFHRDDGPAEQLMLHSAFERHGDRIINGGAFILMIGYARPLRFIGRVIRLLRQRPS